MIKNGVKAIIVVDGRLLCLHCKHEHSTTENDYYCLPGGWVEASEDMYAAIRRKCLEDIGAKVGIRDLLFIRKLTPSDDEFSQDVENFHQTEHIFLCDLARDQNVKMGHTSNVNQVGLKWIPIKALHTYNFYPKKLSEAIQDFVKGEDVPIYLGDMF